MSTSIEDLKKKAEDSTRRGKPIVFADGKTWVIPTMPLKGKGHRVNELADKALKGQLEEDHELCELVELVVKINYPDADSDDIIPDLECAREVIEQYIGKNLGK